MLENTLYVDIVGEPFLSKARAYKDHYEDAMSEWQEFVKIYGAVGIAPGCNGLIFADDVPDEDWTKIVSRSGFSRPKEGTLAYYEMKILPGIPKAWDVFGDELMFEISYEANGQCRTIPVCELWEGPLLTWDDEVIVALIPDPLAAVAQLRKRYPRAKILNGAEEWKLPEGLVITDLTKRAELLAAHAGVYA